MTPNRWIEINIDVATATAQRRASVLNVYPLLAGINSHKRRKNDNNVKNLIGRMAFLSETLRGNWVQKAGVLLYS